MSQVRFRHLRDDFGRPYATLASNGEQVGIALCHERDQFRKDRGRSIAEGRLTANRGYREHRMPRRDVFVNGILTDIQNQIEMDAAIFLFELQDRTHSMS